MRGREDVKYVKRFEETRLSDASFQELVREMRDNGFQTVCTPFDEPSVDKIEAHAIESIKVASCSFTDWPLLERIAQSDKPVIASTAGATLEEIDNVVSFFLHRHKQLTLMHCVAEYPTPDASLQVNQIALLQARYPDCRIGYSTHESPDNTLAVALAVAKGARVFEKHVVLPTARYPANAYSANPAQIRAWLESARRALAICGSSSVHSRPATARHAAARTAGSGSVAAFRAVANAAGSRPAAAPTSARRAGAGRSSQCAVQAATAAGSRSSCSSPRVRLSSRTRSRSRNSKISRRADTCWSLMMASRASMRSRASRCLPERFTASRRP